MTVLQLAPSDRAMPGLPGLRIAAMTCFGLMMVGLGVTLVVLLPEAGASLWPSVPMVTAGLGAATAALFLSGKARHSRLTPSASPSNAAGRPEEAAILAELHALLEQQRAELVGFQESCNTMTRDAMVVGVQLASFALDAEARLTTGIESAERVLTQPSAAMDRAADLAQRLEWTVPETLAAALAGAADAAAQSLGTAAAAATGQIVALGEAAAVLRRDAAALDQAGREIANTGAQAVIRAVEAVGGVTSVASTLPEAAATVAAAAKQAVDTMTLAASVLCSDSAALDASARETVEAAKALRTEATALQTTGVMIAQHVAEAGQAVQASVAALPELQAAMGVQAGQLALEAGALREATQGVTAAGEQLATTASRSEAVLAELPEVAGSLMTATLELRSGLGELKAVSTGLVDTGTAIVTRMEAAAGEVLAIMPGASDAIQLGCKSLEEQVSFIMQGASSIATAGNDAARMITTEAGRAQEAGQGLIDTVTHLLSRADEFHELAKCGPAAAAALHEAVAVMVGEVSSAGTTLRADAEKLGTTGSEAAKATHDLQLQASLLHEAGRTLEAGATEVVEHMRQIARTSVGEIVEASERVAATLGRADASVAAIEDAGRFVASAGQAVTVQMAQLSAICTQTEVQAALLPGLTEQIGSVAGWLRASAQTLPSADMLTEVRHALAPIEKLAAEIERLPAFSARLEQVLQSHATTAVPAEGFVSIMPLRHLGGLEREAAALMAESEALAETVLSGRTADAPIWLTGRTAEILSVVDTTIHRLRSVATAVALASDAQVGPKREQCTDQPGSGGLVGTMLT